MTISCLIGLPNQHNFNKYVIYEVPFTIQNGVILYLLCYPPSPKIPNQELSVVLPSSPLKIGGISVKGLLSFSRTYKQTEITALYM